MTTSEKAPAAAPVEVKYWWEDMEVGSVRELGSVQPSLQQIKDFAAQFDPQPFHLDEEAAARSVFGALCASGWHTCAMAMRLFFDEFLPGSGALSPGVDELRWRAPVRPGDTLHVRVTVEEARISKSKPDRGVIKTVVEVFNQTDAVVMSFRAANFIMTRAALGR